MEPIIRELIQSGVAVDLLVPSVRDDNEQVGVRLRTMGKNLPKDRMVLGEGTTFMEALNEAVARAGERRWERLDWAARPWAVANRGDLNLLASWGLS